MRTDVWHSGPGSELLKFTGIMTRLANYVLGIGAMRAEQGYKCYELKDAPGRDRHKMAVCFQFHGIFLRLVGRKIHVFYFGTMGNQ